MCQIGGIWRNIAHLTPLFNIPYFYRATAMIEKPAMAMKKVSCFNGAALFS
jgi:hypothetical protein